MLGFLWLGVFVSVGLNPWFDVPSGLLTPIVLVAKLLEKITRPKEHSAEAQPTKRGRSRVS